MDQGAWWAAVHRGCQESDTTERLHFFFQVLTNIQLEITTIAQHRPRLQIQLFLTSSRTLDKLLKLPKSRRGKKKMSNCKSLVQNVWLPPSPPSQIPGETQPPCSPSTSSIPHTHISEVRAFISRPSTLPGHLTCLESLPQRPQLLLGSAFLQAE